MLTFDFSNKLQRLNPRLYIDQAHVRLVSKDNWGTSIYLKSNSRKTNHAGHGINYVDAATRNYLTAQYEGSIDELVSGCPTPYVPEYDIFDLATGQLIVKGWRSIVMFLVNKRICTLEKARKVFSSSLGEQPYDRWTFETKLAKAREGTAYAV